MLGLQGRTRATATDRSDLTRLVLRAAIGTTMIAHGVKHGRTLEGTARWFKSIGFDRPEMQARLSSVVEIGSGAAILAGAGTPVSASAVVGTMAVAYRTVHQPNGYFVNTEGWEYVAFISAACAALSALGSGRYSIDHTLGLDRVGNPATRAMLTVGLGVACAAGQLAMFWRKPAAKP